MARRTRRKQSSSSNPMPAIIGTLVFLGLLVSGYFFITREKASNTAALDVDTYMNSPESLQGSTFSIKAEVIKQLHYKENAVKVICVNYNDEHIPIQIPASVVGPNINTKQEYTFIVKAKNDSWLVAKSYTDK